MDPGIYLRGMETPATLRFWRNSTFMKFRVPLWRAAPLIKKLGRYWQQNVQPLPLPRYAASQTCALEPFRGQPRVGAKVLSPLHIMADMLHCVDAGVAQYVAGAVFAAIIEHNGLGTEGHTALQRLDRATASLATSYNEWFETSGWRDLEPSTMQGARWPCCKRLSAHFVAASSCVYPRAHATHIDCVRQGWTRRPRSVSFRPRILWGSTSAQQQFMPKRPKAAPCSSSRTSL